jgi:hypothetical protein
MLHDWMPLDSRKMTTKLADKDMATTCSIWLDATGLPEDWKQNQLTSFLVPGEDEVWEGKMINEPLDLILYSTQSIM